MGVGDNFATPEERAEHFRKLLASRNADPAPASDDTGFDADLVPDIEQPQISEEARKLEDFVQGIDVLDAYRKFIGKMDPQPKGHSREVHISCPIPGHVDNNPSAWANIDTKTWYCGGCGIGGDIYDLAAIGLGYSWPGNYKTKETFPKLKKDLAEAFGLTVHVSPLTGNTTILAPVPDQADEEEDEGQEPELAAAEPAPAPPNLTLVRNEPTPDLPDKYEEIASTVNFEVDNQIDWTSILVPETFHYQWMLDNAIDHLPHEYHFWTGLLALSFAAGRNNTLVDKIPVKGNIFVCIVGETGGGKSQAEKPLSLLLNMALPYSEDPYDDPEGVSIISGAGSGEAIIDSFHYPVKDPSTQNITRLGKVTGLLRQSEFSEIIKKAERTGSSIKEVLIDMYDCSEGGKVSTRTRTSGTREAESPYCSFFATTQDEALNTFLHKNDIVSGLLNRFVFVSGPERTKRQAFAGRKLDISDSLKIFQTTAAWAFAGHEFDLANSPGAPVWEDFFNKHLATPGSQPGIYARIELTLKKLLVLFCVNERLTQPTADVVERVIKLYPYLRATYTQISQDIASDAISQCEHKVTEVCQIFEEKNLNPTAREIYRRMQTNYTTEDIKRALQNLMALGIIEEIPPEPGKRGRPAPRYRYIA